MNATRIVRVLLVDNDLGALHSLKHSLRNQERATAAYLKKIAPDIELDYLAAQDSVTAIKIFQEQRPHIGLVKVIVNTPYSFTSLKDEPGILLINSIKEINDTTKFIAYCVCSPEPRLYYLLKELGADDCIPNYANPRFTAVKLLLMVWEYGLNRIP